jgi:membrane fusion protein (multidrug efflux system)
VSKRDLDDVTANVLAAKAQVFSGQANVANARINLGYTKITSPIKGLTARAAFQDGSLITPNVNGLLTTVSVIDPIWVLFSVSDTQMLQVRGEKTKDRITLPPKEEYSISLELSDGSQFPHSGQVNFASPTLDPETGSMTVRATFDNPEGLILPGQFVRATVSGARRPDAIVVPQTAVSQAQNGMYVFVVENGVARIRTVEVGDWYKDGWIITKGLQPGDLVIANGVNRVQDGTPVTISSS